MNQPTVENSYDILKLTPSASAAEITKAFALATKNRQYPIDVIAKARKALMNPQERVIADLLRPCLPPIQRLKRSDYSELEQPAPVLKFREDLYDLATVTADASASGPIDQELGRHSFAQSPILTPQIERSTVAEPVYFSLPPKPTSAESDSLSASPTLSTALLLLKGIVRELALNLAAPKQPVRLLIVTFLLTVGSIAAWRFFQPVQPKLQSQSIETSTHQAAAGSDPQPSVASLSRNSVASTSSALDANRPIDPIAKSNTQSFQSSPTSSQSSSVSLSSSTSTSSLASSSQPTASPSQSSGKTVENDRSAIDSASSSAASQSLSSCGDQGSSSTDWYPVYVPNTAENLRRVRQQYCRDALPLYRVDKGIQSIQVASFTTRARASDFADQLSRSFDSVEIGKPDSQPVSQKITSSQAISQATSQDSQATASCGSSTSTSTGRWYPVLIDYSERNLQMVRDQYCADAFRKRQEGSQLFRIQVASFNTYQAAADFATELRSTFDSADVGSSYQLP